jgi:hypothetical protein
VLVGAKVYVSKKIALALLVSTYKQGKEGGKVILSDNRTVTWSKGTTAFDTEEVHPPSVSLFPVSSTTPTLLATTILQTFWCF